jgi:hypothetical protein
VSDSRLIFGRSSAPELNMNRVFTIEESRLGQDILDKEDNFNPGKVNLYGELNLDQLDLHVSTSNQATYGRLTEDLLLRRILEEFIQPTGSDFTDVGGVYHSAREYSKEAATTDKEVNPMPRLIWASYKAILEANVMAIGNLFSPNHIECVNDRFQVSCSTDDQTGKRQLTALPGWNTNGVIGNVEVDESSERVPILPKDIRDLRELKPNNVSFRTFADPKHSILRKQEVVTDIARLPFSASYLANQLISMTCKQRARVLVYNCGALTTGQTLLSLNGRLKIHMHDDRVTPDFLPNCNQVDAVILGLDSVGMDSYLRFCEEQYDCSHIVRDYHTQPEPSPEKHAPSDTSLFLRALDYLRPNGLLLVALSTEALGSLARIKKFASMKGCEPLRGVLGNELSTITDHPFLTAHGPNKRLSLALAPKPEDRLLIGWVKR